MCRVTVGSGRAAVVFCGLLAAGIAGCGFPFVSLDALIAGEEAPFLAGRQGDVIEVGKEDYPDQAVDPLAIFDPQASQELQPVERAVRVDLATGEVEPVRDPQVQATVFGSPDLRPVETDRWAARLRLDGPGVVVTDRQTGEQTTYFDDLPDGVMLELVELDGDWLVVQVSRFEGGTSLLVVTDLTTGQQRRIAQVAWWSNLVLRGGWLVFEAIPPFDPQKDPLAALGAPNTLELLDLKTGQQQTILDDAGRIEFPGVRVDDGRVLWVESGETFGRSRIVAWDPASGQPQTLLELALGEDGQQSATLRDFNTRAALVERITSNMTDPSQFVLDPAGLRQTVEYIVIPVGGEPVTILSFENTDFVHPLPRLQVLTDNYAAVLDQDRNTLVVYDLNTGDQRRIPLFE